MIQNKDHNIQDTALGASRKKKGCTLPCTGQGFRSPIEYGCNNLRHIQREARKGGEIYGSEKGLDTKRGPRQSQCMKVSGLASLYGNMRPNCSNELAEFMLGQILLPIIVCRCKVSSGRRFPRDLSTATMPELYAGWREHKAQLYFNIIWVQQQREA